MRRAHVHTRRHSRMRGLESIDPVAHTVCVYLALPSLPPQNAAFIPPFVVARARSSGRHVLPLFHDATAPGGFIRKELVTAGDDEKCAEMEGVSPGWDQRNAGTLFSVKVGLYSGRGYSLAWIKYYSLKDMVWRIYIYIPSSLLLLRHSEI